MRDLKGFKVLIRDAWGGVFETLLRESQEALKVSFLEGLGSRSQGSFWIGQGRLIGLVREFY